MDSISDSVSVPRRFIPKAKKPHDLKGKWCSYCETFVSFREFDTDSTTPDRLAQLCRECADAWTEKMQERNWRYNIKRNYGMVPDQYYEMLAAQDGLCAVCGAPPPSNGFRRLYIDHDHTTRQVRGLLCSDCNVGIGNMRDDPERLESAARYLRKHGK